MPEPLQWDQLTYWDRQSIKHGCEQSFEYFLRVFFQLLQGQIFLKNWHHTMMCEVVEDIFYGRENRVIVNVSPGATKTEVFSVHFPAWGILKGISAEKPFSTRWLPLSYSSDLVDENTARVKEIVESEPFKALWPLKLSRTMGAKSNWMFFDKHGNRHRMFGCSIGGQVTGRRAGFMIDGFSGCLILDDPVSPTIAESAKKLDRDNKRLSRVCRSRLARDDIPIIMVQQRLAIGDSTAFMMSDKMVDDYKLIKIPALIDREYVQSLPINHRINCIRDTGFKKEKTSYWPDKEPTETLLAMNEADSFMFGSQYGQNPEEEMSEGSVYRKQLDKLVSEGRFCAIPIEPSLPVHSFWDLGLNDDMAIWLMQAFGKELRMICCYGNRDEGMEHYINWLHDFADEHEIRYGDHYAPHDIKVRDLMTNQSRIKTAKRMGIKFKLVERCKSKRESIQALKNVFPRIWIDKTRCDTDISGTTGDLSKKTGWKALKALKRDWDPEDEVFKDETGPKWATNYTDAIQQMGLYYKDAASKQPGSYSRNTPRSGSGWQGQ